jgi:carboxyl-terminal processing protease
VQTLEGLKDGSSLKITIAKWLTPNGDNINETGIMPDVEVELTLEDYEADKDPQLDKALEILKNKE